MTASRKTLEDVLLAAQRLGTLGDRPIPEVIEHARYFVQALEGVTGCVADIGTGAGVPGLVIAVDRPDLDMVLVDRRENRMDELSRGVASMGLSDEEDVSTAVEGTRRSPTPATPAPPLSLSSATSSGCNAGNRGTQRGGGGVFEHIDESAAPGCDCLAATLKGTLPVHDCRVLCCY